MAIQTAIAGTIGLMLGGAAASPAFARRQENWWTAARLGALTLNEPTPVVIRVARKDGYTALDSTCTHLGCRVSWDRASRQLTCPCHGGVYDHTGAVLSGPPPQPLATLATRLDGDQVLVQI